MTFETSDAYKRGFRDGQAEASRLLGEFIALAEVGADCDPGSDLYCLVAEAREFVRPAISADDGHCESCDGDRCTAGPKCVATSNPVTVSEGAKP